MSSVVADNHIEIVHLTLLMLMRKFYYALKLNEKSIDLLRNILLLFIFPICEKIKLEYLNCGTCQLINCNFSVEQ